MDLDVSALLSLTIAVAVVASFALTMKRWGRSLTHGGRVDRAAWEMYAAEHHHDYTPDPLRPKIRGVHNGVSFEVGAKVVRHRGRRGEEREYATTWIRATHRADLPPGTVIRAKSWGLALGSLLAGQRAISVDEDYDEFFRIESSNPPLLRELLSDIEVKRAFLALIADLPEAVVHERAIEADLPGMASDLSVLDAYLDRVAAVGNALRQLAPQVERVTDKSTPKPLMTAAELPQRTEQLTSVLRRMHSATSRTSASVQASAMKVRPYEYTLEVRAIVEAVSRLGVPTGGRTVRGILEHSEWRAEISFPPEDNALVEELKPRDRITGLALVDDLTVISRRVECTASTPPVLLQSGKKRAGDPDATGS